MTHIPFDRILPQDKVDMHDHGPAPAVIPPMPTAVPGSDGVHAELAAHHREWVKFHTAEAARHDWKHANPNPVAHRMHVTDARHAMSVDPERWTLAGDKPPYVIAAESGASDE